MAYVSPNWERIRCSSMRSLIQNTRKMRTKAMNPRTWEMAIAMPRNRPECRCIWGDGPRLGTGGNQLVPLLIGDGAASVSAGVLTRPNRRREGRQRAYHGRGTAIMRLRRDKRNL